MPPTSLITPVGSTPHTPPTGPQPRPPAGARPPHAGLTGGAGPARAFAPTHTPAAQGGPTPPHGAPAPHSVGAVQPYQPPSPALRALFAAHAARVPLTRTDLPATLVATLPQCRAAAQAANQPVTELHVAAWLKKLGPLVTNPPGPATAAAQCRAIFEVCADIPAGAWGHAARLAWVRQPPRQGYPVGARWPSPNELRTHLLPYARAITQDVAGCTALMALTQPE